MNIDINVNIDKVSKEEVDELCKTIEESGKNFEYLEWCKKGKEKVKSYTKADWVQPTVHFQGYVIKP